MSATADPTWWLIAAVLFAAFLIACALVSVPATRRQPSRAQVEWEAHIAEAIRLTEEDEAADQAWAELPIYGATAAHIARFAAEDIESEWAEMNGGIA